MALGFVDVQHDPGPGCQRRIYVLQPVRDVLVDRALAYPKFLRRLPHRGIVVYDVIGDGYRTFFNILLQNESPEDFFISYAGDGRNSTPCTDYSVINIVIVQDGSSS